MVFSLNMEYFTKSVGQFLKLGIKNLIIIMYCTIIAGIYVEKIHVCNQVGTTFRSLYLHLLISVQLSIIDLFVHNQIALFSQTSHEKGQREMCANVFLKIEEYI